MASTGPVLSPGTGGTTFLYPGSAAVPGASTYAGAGVSPSGAIYPGSSTYPGQGNEPLLHVLYSTDDVTVTSPTWTYAEPGSVPTRVRAFSTDRGKESELAEPEAGSASITLDDRDRTFDQTIHASIRPLNRWWIREAFAGETQDIFKGYAESYQQQWPGTGTSDALTVVSCVDEFKVLALGKLPTMSPPRDDYESFVQVDTPTSYWRFSDPSMPPTVGSGNLISAAYSILNETPIVGDKIGPLATGNCGSLSLASGQLASADGSSATGQGGAAFSVEFWFRPGTANSSGSTEILRAPLSATTSGPFWRMLHTGTGTITFEVTNNSATVYTVTSTKTMTAGVWHHIVGTVELTPLLRIYINGLQDNTAAFTSIMLDPTNMIANSTFNIGNASATYTRDVDEVAIYFGKTLSAAAVSAHYSTAVNRGFPATQLPGTRVNAVLDTMTSSTPRRVGTGSHQMQGAFMTGQPPIEELRRAVKADAVDGLLFIAKDGALVFLDAAHRSSSPYNTVQATFDDDGTDLPYEDLQSDYSESFLWNLWRVTKDGGVTQTALDQTSKDRYYERPNAITDLPIILDADAAIVAAAMLAKYKDPFTRIVSIALDTSIPEVTEAVFRRDLGDRIRILRTLPGGGARLDQTSFIQKITVDGSPDGPWKVRWVVSPL